MARRRQHVCSTPGCPSIQDTPRCPTHQAERERHLRATTPTKVGRDRDRTRRTATVDAHRDAHGDWCPGWHREPHTSTDLTADHIIEIAAGGQPDGPLQVLCRACNSRKANTATP